MIDWERHRRGGSSINLHAAFRDHPASTWMNQSQINRVDDYFLGIHTLCEITSRQAAAIALETAVTLAVIEDKS